VTEVSHRFTNEMLTDIRSLGINTHSFARTSDYIELARELVRGLGKKLAYFANWNVCLDTTSHFSYRKLSRMS
jgi:cysteinyl-tRNA synthetase